MLRIGGVRHFDAQKSAADFRDRVIRVAGLPVERTGFVQGTPPQVDGEPVEVPRLQLLTVGKQVSPTPGVG